MNTGIPQNLSKPEMSQDLVSGSIVSPHGRQLKRISDIIELDLRYEVKK